MIREGQQIVGRIGARRFPSVTEFEIVHIVDTRSSFNPSDVGSRDGIDTLQFRTAHERDPVIVAGRRFHAVGRQTAIEQQIDPVILRLGGIMAKNVGVPLYAKRVFLGGVTSDPGSV